MSKGIKDNLSISMNNYYNESKSTKNINIHESQIIHKGEENMWNLLPSKVVIQWTHDFQINVK